LWHTACRIVDDVDDQRVRPHQPAPRPLTSHPAGSGLGRTDTGPEPARGLGTADAIVIGLGSLIGAGLFSAFTQQRPQLELGSAGLGIAAVVAY
jgi:hypothetical protein